MKKFRLLKDNKEEQYDEMFDYELYDEHENIYSMYIKKYSKKVLRDRTHLTLEIILNEQRVTPEDLINYLSKFKKT